MISALYGMISTKRSVPRLYTNLLITTITTASKEPRFLSINLIIELKIYCQITLEGIDELLD